MSLRTQLKQAWDALAYADAGELLSFEEKCRTLDVDPPSDYRRYVPETPPAPRHKVALSLGPNLSQPTVDYAIGVAQRSDADLVLLAHATGTPDSVLATIRDAGVPYRIEELRGDWLEAASAYLRRHGEVIFMVLSPSDLPGPGKGAQWPDRARFGFPVPMVVVDPVNTLPQPA